ncbi:MAG TPA: hypothetical protein VLU38_05185 [Methanomassiliicoccales archaeon]|nr:hypothetical protein [Methanomassiliicoccales archaeon]
MSDEKKGQLDKYARQVSKLLDDMGKEMEKAAVTIGKMGEEVYDSLPPKAKSMKKDLDGVIDVVADNLRQDIPKIQKNMENMAKRMNKYAEDIQKAIRSEKK